MTLYIKNTLKAVEFYSKAFGLSLGYNEKHPDGTYMHAELQKDGYSSLLSANITILSWFPLCMSLPKKESLRLQTAGLN